MTETHRYAPRTTRVLGAPAALIGASPTLEPAIDRLSDQRQNGLGERPAFEPGQG